MGKRIILFLFISLLTFNFLLANGDSINHDWYSKALENIKKQEYHITYSEEFDSYQTPNRNNNLRFTYKNNGFIVAPRITETYKVDKNDIGAERKKTKVSDDWKAEFTVLGYGRNRRIETEFKGEEIIVDKNIAFIEDSNMKIDYINNKNGMRQNFTIYNKPKNEKGLFTLSLEVKTKEKLMIGADALVIKSADAREYMKYNSLKIWDADGKALRGWFEKGKNNVSVDAKKIQIVVNDENAKYPIIIDPLSNTAAWSAEVNQESAYFGSSVSTAGDVNGDGFSDVIIGATFFDGDSANSGAAFGFYGSETGLSRVADWSYSGDQEYSWFGNTVSTAGDINGDGYSDIIIGEYNYSNGEVGEGKAFVFHGSSIGLSSSPDWEFESNSYAVKFGVSVSTAGDINGDGYSDVVIGATNYNSSGQTGGIYIFHGSSTGLSSTYENIIIGEELGQSFGNSVSTAGDVNGDGFSDVVVGAKYTGNGGWQRGAAYVYHGSSSGISLTPNTTIYGIQDTANFGKEVSTAGDVNGDGYSDVIIGEVNYDNGEENEGAAYVYHGSSSGLSNIPNWTAESNQAGALFGTSVSTAGDLNGDGFSDVIVGAPDYLYSGIQFDGKAYVYFGSSDGLSINADWDFEFSVGERIGGSVSTAGDVNGDGFSDIIVGATRYTNGEHWEGTAYLFAGGHYGLSDTPNWEAESGQADANFGFSVSSAGDVNADGYSDVVIGAPEFNGKGAIFLYHGASGGPSTTANNSILFTQDGASFGNSISSAGDVNGDGFSDLIVGAISYTNEQTSEGAAFVYHGSSAGLSSTLDWSVESDQPNAFFGNSVATAGDVNGDGYADVIVGAYLYDNGEFNEGAALVYHGSSAGLSLAPDWSAESDQSNASFGNSVSTAGDVNGDGYSDVVIGAYQYDNGLGGEGEAYVFYGSSAGLEIDPTWINTVNQGYAYYGWSVSSAGDINGDGFSDIIVGARDYDNGEIDEGRVYLYLGSAAGLPLIANWTEERDQAGNNFGFNSSPAGDVNGDGYSDFLVSSPIWSTIQSNAGRVFLYHGSPDGIPALRNVIDGTQADEQFGFSIASAGDVNGDGYSDVILGSPYFDNGETDEGKAFLYYGNEGGGLTNRIAQFKPGTSNNVSAGGKTETDGSVRLAMFGKSPFGRADGRIVFEIKQNGNAFSTGNGRLKNSVSNTNVGNFEDMTNFTSGTMLESDFSGLPSNSVYKWRARTEYSLVNNPYQKYGPWRYYANFAVGLAEGFKAKGITLPTNIIAQIKILLEGPYDSVSDIMNTNLIGNIPSTSPYQDALTVSSIPSNVVDWVYVELRDKNDNTNILDSKSCFLLENEQIVGTDGNALEFELPADEYYIVVKHRNHLPVMSADPVPLTTN